nr:MAG TPA: hypothetical protein [Caudoviricetes sp.]
MHSLRLRNSKRKMMIIRKMMIRRMTMITRRTMMTTSLRVLLITTQNFSHSLMSLNLSLNQKMLKLVD